MTEKELRSKVANWMVPYIGISEGSSSHLHILNVYNNSRLCTRYTMTKHDPWCAAATSAAFIATGMAGKPGSGKLFECVECSCNSMISLAKAQGIWVEKDNYIPKVGDPIIYDWSDSGYGDNTSGHDHVGIVTYVNGNTFKVIEGNMGRGTVGYRTMSVNGRYIRGFIAPNYSKFASGAVTETTSKPSTSTNSGAPNKTSKFKGTVIANELNVRSWAGTEFTKLRALKKGTVVDVCDVVKDKDGDDWYYIEESNKYGFVSSEYIAKKETSKPSTSTNNTNNSGAPNKTCKFKGTVIAKSGLNVRSWAGTEFTKLRTLNHGTVVDVCDTVKASTGKTWYYIKESNKYGFVSSEYIARN